MAEEDLDEDEEVGGESQDEDEHESGGKKKLLIVVALAFLLIIGGLAGAYFTGLLDSVISSLTGEAVHEEGVVDVAQLGGVYFDLPELLVNLNTRGKKSQFLKVKISLEIDSYDDISRIEHTMPRIIDNFQVYLRELRLEDIKGAAGMYRLREELLLRVSTAVAPIRVKDVLFREMLIQ